jgi:hypothetical protein
MGIIAWILRFFIVYWLVKLVLRFFFPRRPIMTFRSFRYGGQGGPYGFTQEQPREEKNQQKHSDAIEVPYRVIDKKG